MRAALSRFSTEKPVLVYAIVALLTLVCGAMIAGIRIDTDPENMLQADQPDRVYHNEAEERFGIHDAIVVGVVNETHPDGIYNADSLSVLHELTRRIETLDGVVVADLMSLASSDNISQEGPGVIRFEWMMKDAPVSDDEARAIRAKVERLPMLVDTLVSGDGQAAAIYVPIESKDLSYPLSQEIRAIADSIETDSDIHITGLPVAEDTFGHDMFVQMGISAPLAGLMIFLLMLYFFRSPVLVIAPMLVAMATVLITMGILIGMGFTVHIMSSMIPIFLMPIAVVDSVHIMSEFADRYTSERTAKETIREVVGHLFTPMLYTSLTSAIGFLSLLLTPIPPVQIFGAFVAFGILLAFLLTIVLIPAYVVRMKPASLAKLDRPAEATAVDTPLARALRVAGRTAVRHGKLITAAAVVVIAISVAGIYKIEINDNPVRWFKANHPIRVADRVLNDHFAGTYDSAVVFSRDAEGARLQFVADARPLAEVLDPGVQSTVMAELDASGDDIGAYYGNLIAAIDDALFEVVESEQVLRLEELMSLAEAAQFDSKYFQRPDVLRSIEQIQEALQASGYVGKTSAVTDVVKVVNRELRGGDPANYVIPDTPEAVAQTLLQFQSSHRPHDLWHILTPDLTSAAIWVQLTSGDNKDMSRVLDFLDAYLEENPLPPDVEMHWAGKNFINVVWQDNMVNGMLSSLGSAFAAVFIMMALLFRSIRIGLLAMVPLSITIVGVYGIIGWIGKDYDMPIAVLSSLTLGLSVDFAIHFIERCRALMRHSGSFDTAMREVFEEPARAIARNAIVIAIGFTPLFFAPLVPYITVGAFMAAIMALSGVTTLIVLPALMSWAGPWLFVEQRRQGVFTAAAQPA
ncbi:MAG: efflux RND transporter permease subunit [Woeseiaceae bacterium]|nr:efflux RND transporter permease subunit [Woeseiaceae bacterium]